LERAKSIISILETGLDVFFPAELMFLLDEYEQKKRATVAIRCIRKGAREIKESDCGLRGRREK
jgi:hypothetical protein